jgi:transposase
VYPISKQPGGREHRGRVRFKNLARKVILKNRKEVAKKAIARAEEKLKNTNHAYLLRSPGHGSSRRGSMFGLNNEVIK